MYIRNYVVYGLFSFSFLFSIAYRSAFAEDSDAELLKYRNSYHTNRGVLSLQALLRRSKRGLTDLDPSNRATEPPTTTTTTASPPQVNPDLLPASTTASPKMYVTITFEPRHEKISIVRLRPAWIQTSLRIRAVWSGSMLFAFKAYCN
ncbi:uncharacterized protein LOC123548063 [Mercenaria mercenaria]|uniref:uncharacterized protein LOC123548063 n=1 Tax=Mercenaria mercenaria TaxID=6596 RepID=UPI00234F1860|nr:uncharacterized protein LOC123548063 [Mercenaria mercenaria]